MPYSSYYCFFHLYTYIYILFIYLLNQKSSLDDPYTKNDLYAVTFCNDKKEEHVVETICDPENIKYLFLAPV